MMKTLIYITTIAVLLALFACKKVTNKTMSVVRDCTGTYLRFDGEDYQVCNLEKVASFPNGTVVKATFKKMDECFGLAGNSIVCDMLHINEGWIQVEKID